MFINSAGFFIFCNPRAIKTKKKGGFSFVEMMVVLALFALVGVCLSSSFISGLRVYKKAALFGLVGRNRLNLERLSFDLRRARVYDGIGFCGQPDSVTFASVYNDKIWKISYAFFPEQSAVVRTREAKKNIEGGFSAGTARKVLFGIQNWTLSYYGCCKCHRYCGFYPEWNYEWSGIPFAVKVRMVLKGGRIIEKVIPVF